MRLEVLAMGFSHLRAHVPCGCLPDVLHPGLVPRDQYSFIRERYAQCNTPPYLLQSRPTSSHTIQNGTLPSIDSDLGAHGRPMSLGPCKPPSGMLHATTYGFPCSLLSASHSVMTRPSTYVFFLAYVSLFMLASAQANFLPSILLAVSQAAKLTPSAAA